MTEKRFKNVEVDKKYRLICMNDNITFRSLSEESLEDLLNELNDENEQLKQRIKELKVTENKRFELIPHCNREHIWYGLFDNQELKYICNVWDGSSNCERLLNEQHETIQHLSNIINCLEKGSCRSIDSFLDMYCTDEILKEFDLDDFREIFR